jgi:mycothiol synthase
MIRVWPAAGASLQQEDKMKDQVRRMEVGLVLRSVRHADVHQVAQLIYDVCAAEGDVSVAVTPEELAAEWRREGFDPQRDAFLVEEGGGQVVGYVSLEDKQEHCDLLGDLYVHPQYRGQAVGAALVEAMERRAEEHVQLAAPGLRVAVRVALDHKDEAGKALFKAGGYAPVRYYWRMETVLAAAPPAPVLPAGLALRPFVQGEHARAVCDARNDAFQDHWGNHELSFEGFTFYNLEHPEYDPDLWGVIWDADEVAAFAINRFKMGIGWVQTLGVRPAWRKKGLGLALLQDAFGRFWQRGMKTIGLTVDAANPTGATRLYQKGGMQAVSEFVLVAKELRAGE